MAVHWSEEVVDRLRERGDKHVIETGTSISGIPHVGNASDVIRGDCVRKALLEGECKAELIWVADDSDPFRKVPAGMESLADYLGYPVRDIPDPDGCHGSFVEHFAEPFVKNLESFGVKPTVYSGTELYRTGQLTAEIKTAFENRDKIREILNQYRREPLPEDYIPWSPVCGNCGRISTTNPASLDGLKVGYECVTSDVSGSEVEGCGHSGESDASKGLGKMPWRVEWAARWSHFKVTCEPFGKEHAAPGGSYDTSSIVSREVFGWMPPEPVIYEFFTLNGEKISSSQGNVITLSDWLGIAEPEVLKYFMYKRLQKQRDINLSMLPNLVDEYDEAERIYFRRQDGDSGLARMYGLAQTKEPRYLNVPYTLCAVLGQVSPDEDVRYKVESMGYGGFDPVRLKRRVRLAGNWVQTHGPEYLRFKLNSVEESRIVFSELPEAERNCLTELADSMAGVNPEQFHKTIYETARSHGLKPPKLFKSIYRMLIGKDKGPKAAAFMLSLGKADVKSRFTA